jgi:hypothetical protein
MNSNRRKNAFYGITIIVIIILLMIFYCIFKYNVEMSNIYSVYNGLGVRLSECEMKDGLPWEGSYIKNTNEIDQGNYIIEFYRHGGIEKCLAYVNDMPVIGILGKGREINTLKVKIIDANKYTMGNSMFFSIIKDKYDSIIHNQLLGHEGELSIIVDLKPDNIYTLYVKNDVHEYKRYTFAIDKTSGISNVCEYVVGLRAYPPILTPGGD